MHCRYWHFLYHHNGLTLFIDIIHHPYKILLIVTVIPVALRYNRLHILQGTLYDIMHDRNGDPVLFQFIYFIDHILTDMLFFFFR